MTMLAATGCGAGVATGTARSALLLSLDTTRADALGCYGGEALTPTLDRLAAEGLLFERAQTVAPITLPAHASMLTGLYPLRHGLRDNGAAALAPAARTLAERARAEGFQTAAFVASIVLARPFGLDQGFDRYDVPARSADGGLAQALHGAERRAAAVIDGGLAWLAARDRARPFFLWLHVYDPHFPYDPPRPTASADPYLGEIEVVDAEVGRLVAVLEADGTLDETTLVVVGDHGEAFGEHGELTHAAYCYRPTLEVPLFVRAPDGRRAGERSRAVVSVVDVYPTLAAAMGLPPEPDAPAVDGRSLWDEQPAERGVYFESYYGYFAHGWSPLAGWMDARGKYLHSSRPELFDPVADPAEADDLLEREPRRAEPYRRAIAALDALPKLASGGAEMDEELLASIQHLGYGGLADAEGDLPGPLDPSARPSPQSRAIWFASYARAQEHLAAGRLEEAAAVYEGVLAENPSNFLALEELGGLRFRQGRVDEATVLLERLTREGPQRGRHHFSLGLCYRAQERWAEALDAVRRAVALSPRRARYEKALRELERLAPAGEE